MLVVLQTRERPHSRERKRAFLQGSHAFEYFTAGSFTTEFC